jgi:Rrf2 family protein
MRTSCRFAVAVHVLTLLSCKESGRGTSEALAASVNTNPVVIRRLMQSLQAAGIIETHKGAGAGSRLARRPAEITLAEIQRAVDLEQPFFLPLREASQDCPVGQRIKSVLTGVFASIEKAIEAELSKTTLADVCEALSKCPGSSRWGHPAPGAAQFPGGRAKSARSPRRVSCK